MQTTWKTFRKTNWTQRMDGDGIDRGLACGYRLSSIPRVGELLGKNQMHLYIYVVFKVTMTY